MLASCAPLRSPHDPSSRIRSEEPADHTAWQAMLLDRTLDLDARAQAAFRIAKHLKAVGTEEGLSSHYPGLTAQLCSLIASSDLPIALRVPCTQLLSHCLGILQANPREGNAPLEKVACSALLTNAQFVWRLVKDAPQLSPQGTSELVELFARSLQSYLSHPTANSRCILEIYDQESPPLFQAAVLEAIPVYIRAHPDESIAEGDREHLIRVARRCAAVYLQSPDIGASQPGDIFDLIEKGADRVGDRLSLSPKVLSAAVTAGIMLGDWGCLEYIEIALAQRRLDCAWQIHTELSAILQADGTALPGDVRKLILTALELLRPPSAL